MHPMHPNVVKSNSLNRVDNRKQRFLPVFPPYSNSIIDLTKLWIDKAKDNMERITRNLSYIKKILQSIV